MPSPLRLGLGFVEALSANCSNVIGKPRQAGDDSKA
jgi:hypothetical protein